MPSATRIAVLVNPAEATNTESTLKDVDSKQPMPAFVGVSDPVGAAFVDSMARPGGKITGFTQFEYGISAKWPELLKEIASRVTRVAVLRNPTIAAGSGQLGALQAVAPSLGVELRPVDVRHAEEIERAVAAFVRGPTDGLIVTGGGSAVYRNSLFRLPPATTYRRFILTATTLPMVDLSRMVPIWSINSGKRPAISTAFSRAKTPAIYQCKQLPSINWLSISRRPRRSASKCHRHCSPAPTR